MEVILFRYISELSLYCSRLTATLKIVSQVATHINESMKKMVCAGALTSPKTNMVEE